MSVNVPPMSTPMRKSTIVTLSFWAEYSQASSRILLWVVEPSDRIAGLFYLHLTQGGAARLCEQVNRVFKPGISFRCLSPLAKPAPLIQHMFYVYNRWQTEPD